MKDTSPARRAWLSGVTLLIAVVAAVAVATFLVRQFEPTTADAIRTAKFRLATDAANILASERVAYYTEVLAVFTGALAAFGIVQLRFLVRADSIASRNAEAATLAATAAADAAASAGAQAAIAERQAVLLDQQKEIQRQQFFAEHRPRLVLRDVYLPGHHDAVSFELSNIGGTAARIVGGFVAFTQVAEERDFKDPKMWAPGTAANATVAPGEMAVFTCNAGPGVATTLRYPDMQRIRSLDDPEPPKAIGHTYFFGIIKYVDERGGPADGGVVRSTVFRRLFHQGDQRFLRTENPDHEYAD
jgi:hypothetical protein